LKAISDTQLTAFCDFNQILEEMQIFTSESCSTQAPGDAFDLPCSDACSNSARHAGFSRQASQNKFEMKYATPSSFSMRHQLSLPFFESTM
jgi:hypothetical protein